MKRKIISVIAALAMIAATAAVSFADTAAEKAAVSIVSGNTTVSAVAYDNYDAGVVIDGDEICPAYADITVDLNGIKSLGMEEDEHISESFRLESGITGTMSLPLIGYVPALSGMTGTQIKVDGSVNGIAFAYDITGGYDVAAKKGEWLAKASGEVSEAWAELANHVTLDGPAGDGSAATGADWKVTGEVIEMNLPAGTQLKIDDIIAELAVGTRITIKGVDFDTVLDEDGNVPDLLADVAAAVDSGNETAVINAVLTLLNTGAEVINETSGISVIVETDCDQSCIYCDCSKCGEEIQAAGPEPPAQEPEYDNTDGVAGPEDTEAGSMEYTAYQEDEAGSSASAVDPEKTDTSAQTGDDTPLALLGAVMLIALAVILCTLRRKAE